MGTVRIKNCILGTGRPKIAVSLTQPALPELLSGARALRALPADLAEWRLDWFAAFSDPKAVKKAGAELRAALGDLPLLVSFRTEAEGGHAALPPEEYRALLLLLAGSGIPDLLDVELSAGEDTVRAALALCRAHGVRTVLSRHDFEKTPPRAEMLACLETMQELGADVVKLAVMPRDAGDVLALLDVTREFSGRPGAAPAVTMSMGGLGSISRLAGECFGSAVTFGAAGAPSAPGQLEAGELAAALGALHRSLGGE